MLLKLQCGTGVNQKQSVAESLNNRRLFDAGHPRLEWEAGSYLVFLVGGPETVRLALPHLRSICPMVSTPGVSAGVVLGDGGVGSGMDQVVLGDGVVCSVVRVGVVLPELDSSDSYLCCHSSLL